MKKLLLLDFLKGYAIFTIVIYHILDHIGLPAPFDKIIMFGGSGVHLFVLLSGFGLYLSHLKKPIPYFDFLKKRLSRIYVPYIAIIIIAACLSLFVPLYENSLYALGGHLFLYKMFDEAIMGSYGYPFWFLSMIIQFYLAFHALVYLATKTTRFQFMAVSCAISFGWIGLVLFLGKQDTRVYNSFFLQYLWEFALGMMIAKQYTANGFSFNFKLKNVYLLLFALLNIGLYGFLSLKGGSMGRMVNDIPALLGYSFLAVWLYCLKIKPIDRFFLVTGGFSYSTYLVHVLVIELVLLLSASTSPWYIGLLCILLIYPLAYGYEQFMALVLKRPGFYLQRSHTVENYDREMQNMKLDN